MDSAQTCTRQLYSELQKLQHKEQSRHKRIAHQHMTLFSTWMHLVEPVKASSETPQSMRSGGAFCARQLSWIRVVNFKGTLGFFAAPDTTSRRKWSTPNHRPGRDTKDTEKVLLAPDAQIWLRTILSGQNCGSGHRSGPAGSKHGPGTGR